MTENLKFKIHFKYSLIPSFSNLSELKFSMLELLKIILAYHPVNEIVRAGDVAW